MAMREISDWLINFVVNFLIMIVGSFCECCSTPKWYCCLVGPKYSMSKEEFYDWLRRYGRPSSEEDRQRFYLEYLEHFGETKPALIVFLERFRR